MLKNFWSRWFTKKENYGTVNVIFESATLIEGGRGVMGTPQINQPSKPLKLYEFEGSIFVAVFVKWLLNLDVEFIHVQVVKNIAKSVKEKGGKNSFLLIDENTAINSMSHKQIHSRIYSNTMVKVNWGNVEKFSQWSKFSLYSLF